MLSLRKIAKTKSAILVLLIWISSVKSLPTTDLRQIDSDYYVSCSKDYCNFCCLKVSNGSIHVIRYVGVGFKQINSSFCKEGLLILGSCQVNVDYVVDIDQRTTVKPTETTSNAPPPPPSLPPGVRPIPARYAEFPDYLRCPDGQRLVDNVCVGQRSDEDEEDGDDEEVERRLPENYIRPNCQEGLVFVNGRCRNPDEG